jgi:hypothetical protein
VVVLGGIGMTVTIVLAGGTVVDLVLGVVDVVLGIVTLLDMGMFVVVAGLYVVMGAVTITESTGDFEHPAVTIKVSIIARIKMCFN